MKPHDVLLTAMFAVLSCTMINAGNERGDKSRITCGYGHALVLAECIDKTCPACGQANMCWDILRSYQDGKNDAYQDVFFPYTANGCVYSCQRCLFSCFVTDINPIPDDKIDLIRKGLAHATRPCVTQDWDTLPMSTSLALAESTYRLLGRDEFFWCMFYRVKGTWLAYENNADGARAARLKAHDIATRLLAAPHTEDTLQNLLFIRGGMRYFTGDTNGALADFALVLQHHPTNQCATCGYKAPTNSYYETAARSFAAEILQRRPIPPFQCYTPYRTHRGVFAVLVRRPEDGDWGSLHETNAANATTDALSNLASAMARTTSVGGEAVAMVWTGDGDSPYPKVFVRGYSTRRPVWTAFGKVPNLMFEMTGDTTAKIAVPLVLAVHMDSMSMLDYPWLFLSGHGDFRLHEREVEWMRNYLLHGYALIVNNGASGKGSPFDMAFRRELKRIIPDHELHAIDGTHPLFNLNLRYCLCASDRPRREPTSCVASTHSAAPVEVLEMEGRILVVYNTCDCEALLRARLDSLGTNILSDVRTDGPATRREDPPVDTADTRKNTTHQGGADPQRVRDEYNLYMNIVTYLMTR